MTVDGQDEGKDRGQRVMAVRNVCNAKNSGRHDGKSNTRRVGISVTNQTRKYVTSRLCHAAAVRQWHTITGETIATRGYKRDMHQ